MSRPRLMVVGLTIVGLLAGGQGLLRPGADGQALAADGIAEPPFVEETLSPLLDGRDDGLTRLVVEVGEDLPHAPPAASAPGADTPDHVDREAPAAPADGIEWRNDASNPLHLDREDLSDADRALLQQLQVHGGPEEADPPRDPALAADVVEAVTGDAAPLIDALLAVDGIEEVTPAGAGFLAVATTLTAEDVAAIPGVASVTDDPLRGITAFDLRSLQWPLGNTQQPGIDIRWSDAVQRATGQGVVVAVIDTGIETTHPDLAQRMWQNPGEVCGNARDDDGNGFVDDCNGWDFANNDGSVFDSGASNGHGTHVAGTIAADDDADATTGVAPDARIMSVKVFHNGGATSSRVAQAIEYAVANGADVINMSLGGYGTSSAEIAAVNRATAAGVVMVAATGNDSLDITHSVFYPAGHDVPAMIAVSATDRTDAQSSFSNYSATLADLHAPGTQILASYPGGGAAYMSGTSMAAPHVAGVAAMLAQRGVGGSAARDTIMQTAHPVAGLTGRSLTGGRLDAAAAVGIPAGASARFGAAFTSMHDAQPGLPDDAAVVVTGTSPDPGTSVVLRGTVGYVHGGQLYAVTDLALTIGDREVQTDDRGQVLLGGDPALTAAEMAQLPEGLEVPIRWTLPAGRFAVAVEAVDAADATPLGRPSLVTFTVAAAPDSSTPPDGPTPTPTPPPGEEAPADPAPPPATSPNPPPPPPADPEPSPSPTHPPTTPAPPPGGTTPPPSGTTPPPPGDTTPPPGDTAPPPPVGTTPPPGHPTPPPPGDATPPPGDPTPPPPGGATPPPGATLPPPVTPPPGDGGSVEDPPPPPARLTVTGAVSPAEGPNTGQNRARLTIAHPIPADARVQFGGRAAHVLGQGADHIDVIVPAHVPGLVDVDVFARNGDVLTVADAYTYLTDSGELPPDPVDPPDGDPAPGDPAPDDPHPDPSPGDPGDGDTTPDPGPDDPAPPTPEDPGDGGDPAPDPGTPPPPGSSPPPDGDPPPSGDGSLEVNGLRLRPLPSDSPLAGVAVSGLSSRSCTQPTCAGWNR